MPTQTPTADPTADLAADPAADTTAAAATPEQIEAFVGRFVGDLAAVAHAATVVLGDKLGLYRALAAHGPATPDQLAAVTGCDARYLREWLLAQAASEYAHYDAETGAFWLDGAQAACLADDSLPTFVAGGMGVFDAPRRGRRAGGVRLR